MRNSALFIYNVYIGYGHYPGVCTHFHIYGPVYISLYTLYNILVTRNELQTKTRNEEIKMKKVFKAVSIISKVISIFGTIAIGCGIAVVLTFGIDVSAIAVTVAGVLVAVAYEWLAKVFEQFASYEDDEDKVVTE